MTDYADDLIIEYGEQLYGRPVKAHPAKKSSSALLIAMALSKRTRTTREDRVRKLATLTARKAPEVLVKISGTNKGMGKIQAHFEYISRNGKVELENQDGELVSDRAGVRDLCDEWKNGQFGIPDLGIKREAFNIVLSMPPGTERSAVTSAARDFASDEFGANYQYVFATHDDEKHPHVHLCVKALGIDGTRLNPRKQDLQAWRERFAEKLRDHGIEANATPRNARGVTRNPESQKRLHKNWRNEGTERALPASERFLRNKTLQAYEGLAKTLAQSTDKEDRQLALQTIEFVKDFPNIRSRFSRRQEIVIEDGKVARLNVSHASREGPERG